MEQEVAAVGWDVLDELRDIAHTSMVCGDLPNFDYIIGISRGGLVPAVVLSHCLGTPMIPISVSSYQDKVQGKKVFLNAGLLDSLPLEGKRLLVVDDIWDTGVTSQVVQGFLWAKGVKEASFWFLYAKAKPIMLMGFESQVLREVDKKVWVDFEWEKLN